jgi:hypothetical protein
MRHAAVRLYKEKCNEHRPRTKSLRIFFRFKITVFCDVMQYSLVNGTNVAKELSASEARVHIYQSARHQVLETTILIAVKFTLSLRGSTL